MEKTITVATDFSRTPGGRYIIDGPFSGEDFRKKFLEPHFCEGGGTAHVTVLLDGVVGYATSFLEEAFGGLARIFGSTAVKQRLTVVSHVDPSLAEEVAEYIEKGV